MRPAQWIEAQDVKQISADRVGTGDIIDGPDGPSTVVDILKENGFLRFDFAEGKGNRCYSGVNSGDKVLLLKKSTDEYHGGFIVNTQGEVVMTGAYIVKVGAQKVRVVDVNGREHRINRSEIRHIIGQFTLVLNSAD